MQGTSTTTGIKPRVFLFFPIIHISIFVSPFSFILKYMKWIFKVSLCNKKSSQNFLHVFHNCINTFWNHSLSAICISSWNTFQYIDSLYCSMFRKLLALSFCMVSVVPLIILILFPVNNCGRFTLLSFPPLSPSWHSAYGQGVAGVYYQAVTPVASSMQISSNYLLHAPHQLLLLYHLTVRWAAGTRC